MAGSPFDPPLLYARCWEDDLTLRAGLRIAPGDRVFSIASAGDNSFSLLLDDPAEVVLLDRNRTQLALCRLKILCIRHLDSRIARRFLGFDDAPASERLQQWEALSGELSESDRTLLNQSPDAIAEGLCNVGKFERYLSTFRNAVLPIVQWPGTVVRMAALTDIAEQRALYEGSWDSWRWRMLFRAFFGRRVMERLGRERAFFDHVTEESVGDVFRKRAEKALTELPAATNPYLRWVLTRDSLSPAYLDPLTQPLIRERLDRLRIIEGDLGAHIDEAGAGAYDAYNLSDCFEYMSSEDSDRLLTAIAHAGRPGARLVYWNLLVPRDGGGVEELIPEPALARRLHATDRAFFYGRLVVEHVRP